ncbi:MAG: hypothetical protein ACKO8G_07015 [Actinomycetota bacterium]
MIATGSCIGFNIACDTLLKGAGVTVVGFVLFVGCVLLLLSAIFGRTMGYLVLATALFGWMALLSALWTFGFFSQGVNTPVNLGPRGEEPAWAVEAAGIDPAATFDAYAAYPSGDEWRTLGAGTTGEAARQSLASAVQGFLAEEANAEAGLEEFDPEAFQTSDFAVQDIRFATDGDTSLGAARAYAVDGGPVITVYLRHDRGSEAMYSWLFLVVSIIGLAVHVPFLDRAERKRKDILTGGGAPPWHGPA